MSGLKLRRTVVAVVMTLGVTGCFAATPLPHRGLRIDLLHAGARKDTVVTVIEKYLLANKFRYAGKAGYDAISGTDTVHDFYGEDGISVSIYLDYSGAVLVGIDEDGKCFSSYGIAILGSLERDLDKHWPGSVVRTAGYGADCTK